MNSPPFLTKKVQDQPGRVAASRTCLLVLGMHRSGTSAITRLLSLAGAKLPATLLGAGKGNEAGHWESSVFLKYNDRLLEELGGTWDDWRALDVARLAPERRRQIKGEICDLLAAEFADAPLFVVKDPRICRFAPLFLEALDDADIAPRVVHIFRNPLEVAESLERRDGLLPSAAALQWLRHVLDGEAETRTRRCAIISYDTLLGDWRAALQRITEALHITWPHSSDDIAGQVAQFLSSEHRHHAHTIEDVLLDPAIRAWVGEAYAALQALEHEPHSKAARATLDAIRGEFDRAAPIFHRLQTESHDVWNQQLAQLRAALAEKNAEVERHAVIIAEKNAQGERHAAAIAEKSAEVERLAAAIAEKNAEIEQQAAALAEKIAEVEQRSAALAERGQEMSRLEVALRQRDAHIAQLGVALDEGTAAAAAASAERIQEIFSLETALKEAHEPVAKLKSLIEQRDRQLKRMESEKCALIQQAQLGHQDLIDHFRNSTSWKITRPLRALKKLLPYSALPSRLPRPFIRAKQGSDSAASIIAESELFDQLYYLSLVHNGRIRDPVRHYLEEGHKNGLNPNPLFDSDYYATVYAAQLDDNVNPFVHFIQFGSREGYDPSRLFQTAYYRDSNPDVGNNDVMPLLHYLKKGRVEGRMPIDVDQSALDPLALQLHRLDLTSPSSDEFNAKLYAALYPSLADAYRDDGLLRSHFEANGRAEGRIASWAALLKASRMPPEAVPINFNETEYYELNADLSSALPHTFFHAIQHYLSFGIRERRRYSYSQCYIEPPWRQPARRAPIEAAQPFVDTHKIACLVHVYYPEIWPELHRYIRNLDCARCDVFVNVTDSMWSEELHARIHEDVPGVSIVVSENKGRDIGGYLNCLTGIRIDDYAAFFLVHTKKSKHFAERYSENWRNSLLEPLLGSAETILDNLALLNTDPKVGIIGAAAWRHKSVDKNSAHYNYLLQRFDIDPAHADCDYVSGTMMIVRASILKRMYEVLSQEEFENADGKSDSWLRDGQLEHAAERLFANLCKSAGCRIHWC